MWTGVYLWHFKKWSIEFSGNENDQSKKKCITGQKLLYILIRNSNTYCYHNKYLEMFVVFQSLNQHKIEWNLAWDSNCIDKIKLNLNQQKRS